jgi:hypothetical protein
MSSSLGHRLAHQLIGLDAERRSKPMGSVEAGEPASFDALHRNEADAGGYGELPLQQRSTDT